MATQPQPPNPPAPTPEAQPQPQETHEQRLFRSVSQELSVLREQMQGMPSLEELEDLRSRAARFDALAQELPEWKQQLEGLHEQEVAALRQRAEEQAAALDRSRFENAARDAYVRAGGRAELFADFMRLAGDRLDQAPDGSVLLDGQDFRSGFDAAVEDRHTVMASFALPKLGSGSGARSTRDGRAMPGQRMSIANTDKATLFAAGFGRGGAA